MLLNEVFKGGVQWETTRHDPDKFEADFTLSGNYYTFLAYVVNEYENIWVVEFAYKADKFSNRRRYDIMKLGSSFGVFATIVSIMRSFIAKYNPASIVIEAEEPSRMSLYRKMVARLLPTWHITPSPDPITIHLTNPNQTGQSNVTN